MVTCLVCLGFLTMDSSIWVAQMMGLPNMLHSANICFLAINTFSVPSFCQVLDFLLNLNLGDDPDALSLVTQSPIMSLNMNECVIGFQLLWRLWQEWQHSPAPSQCPLPVSPSWWMAQSWSPQLQSREKRSSKLLRTFGNDSGDVCSQTIHCD